MRLRSTLIALLAGATLLLVAVAPAVALPPQYPAGWLLQPGGLRQVALSTDQRALCKGPSGTVYEVALGYGVDSFAVIERVRVSDGTSIKRWTYPETAVSGVTAPPGPGVIPEAAASDPTGNLYVAAETTTGTRDWVVLKYSSAGKRIWRRAYDSGRREDTPHTIAVDHHGAVIVGGAGAKTDGADGVVVKWSANGRLKWRRTVTSAGPDVIDAVAVDAKDNVYAAGRLGGAGGVATAVVRSWTPGGRTRWQASVTNALAAPAWRFLTVKGTSVYVAGQTAGVPSLSSFMAMRYTTSGKRGWRAPRALAFAHGAWVNGLAVDAAGAAVLVGTAYDVGASKQDAGAVWKIGAAGATAWSRTFTSGDWPHDGEFDAVGVDGAGRVYAAGGQDITAAEGDLLLVRYSARGAEQALWRASGPIAGHCRFTDLLVLGDTRVVAAGRLDAGSPSAVLYRAQTRP